MVKTFKKLTRHFNILKKVNKINRYYELHINRIRNRRTGTKIKVLFLVSEIAKWKEQSLYEAMARSEDFDPVVAISAYNGQSEGQVPNDRLEDVLLAAERFFDRMGDRHVRAVKIAEGRRVFSDLSEFNPDIVYYTEPWMERENHQTPEWVSRFALTCYSPYYVPNYSSLKEACKLPLHRFLWNYYCMGASEAKYFASAYHPFKNYRTTTSFVGVGHPALDFYLHKKKYTNSKIVIYAPHCTIAGGTRTWIHHYGTFRWSGDFILEYAKANPEIKWVFKPHPQLRYGIKRAGLMSDEEIDTYYSEWRRIGTVCEDSDYQELFLDSFAMITDCGSFLSEYGATERPIIHLISSDNKYKPLLSLTGLYDTYYKVHNTNELITTLKMVIERREDPMRERRVEALKSTGMIGVNASEEIIRHLRNQLSQHS
jgi:hypothetical protein